MKNAGTFPRGACPQISLFWSSFGGSTYLSLHTPSKPYATPLYSNADIFYYYFTKELMLVPKWLQSKSVRVYCCLGSSLFTLGLDFLLLRFIFLYEQSSVLYHWCYFLYFILSLHGWVLKRYTSSWRVQSVKTLCKSLTWKIFFLL